MLRCSKWQTTPFIKEPLLANGNKFSKSPGIKFALVQSGRDVA